MCLEVVVEEGFGFSVNQGTGTSFSWHFQWVRWHWNLVWSCAPVKCGRGFKSPLPNNSIFIIPTLSLLLEEILATTLCKSICLPYPIGSWRFCRKTRFEASRVVFWSLSCYKELKLTTNRFTGRTLGGLLIQMQNISLRSSGMRRKQNFDIVFGFKSDTAVLTFTFRFLSSLLFLLFLPHFFFLLLGI